MELDQDAIHRILSQELQAPFRLQAAEHPSLAAACQIPFESESHVKMHCLPGVLCIASPQGSV